MGIGKNTYLFQRSLSFVKNKVKKSALNIPTFTPRIVRYFLEIAYDGGAYHGWQVQDNAKSVQGVLNSALTTAVLSDLFNYLQLAS